MGGGYRRVVGGLGVVRLWWILLIFSLRVKADLSTNSSGQSDVISDQPPLINNQSHIKSNQPPIITNLSLVIGDQSQIANGQPPMFSNQSHMISDQSQITSDQPPIINNLSHVIGDQSQINNEQPQITSEQPQITSDQPTIINDDDGSGLFGDIGSGEEENAEWVNDDLSASDDYIGIVSFSDEYYIDSGTYKSLEVNEYERLEINENESFSNIKVENAPLSKLASAEDKLEKHRILPSIITEDERDIETEGYNDAKVNNVTNIQTQNKSVFINSNNDFIESDRSIINSKHLQGNTFVNTANLSDVVLNFNLQVLGDSTEQLLDDNKGRSGDIIDEGSIIVNETDVTNEDLNNTTDNSPSQNFFISRPLPLISEESGPNIQTNITRFFSLFELTENVIQSVTNLLKSNNDDVTESFHKESDHDSMTTKPGEKSAKQSTTEVITVTTESYEITGISNILTTAHVFENNTTTEPEDISTTNHGLLCDCDCGNRYKYHMDNYNEQDDNTNIVLQNSQRICSQDEIKSCCIDLFEFVPVIVEPRFKFPDGPNDIIVSSKPDIDVAENVLVDEEGIPKECLIFLENIKQNEIMEIMTSTTPPPNTLDGITNTEVIFENNESFLNNSIPSLGSWNLLLDIQTSATLIMTLSSRTGLALLGRRNSSPSLVQFDILDILNGRSMSPALYKLQQGTWHFSLKNEESFDQDVLLIISKENLEDDVTGCCNIECHSIMGKETCNGGQVCDNGHITNGECICLEGWLGPSCNVSRVVCREQVCSGNGDCQAGAGALGFVEIQCLCDPSHAGDSCAQEECDMDCGENGVCQSGGQGCRCFTGWEGENCTQKAVLMEVVCPLNIEPTQVPCELPCGDHGACKDGYCHCQPGWEGVFCDEKMCDSRCHQHGICYDGVCDCQEGWGGIHCTLDQCPGACSGHGECSSIITGWWCQCQQGWSGVDCSIPLELNCTDRLDNDQDGLTDCEDPECCWNEACSKSQNCKTVPDPQSILLMKTALPEFASFFHRTKFLVEDGSLQKFASLPEFDPKRVSVIRGRVVTPRGEGLMGARVQYQSRKRSDIKKGITLTRDDGWFDFLVNGGGIVTLMFGKSPFPFQSRSIYVPWNQIVVMDEVRLAFTKKREGRLTKSMTVCQEQTTQIKPVIKVVHDESDGVKEIIDLEDSTTKLVHSSWKSSGYLPKLEMKLLDALPSTLLAVHYRITIEGKVYWKVLEPDEDMMVTFVWDGRNAYGQKVYGNSRAIVCIGYKHKMCPDIVWITQEVSLHGFRPKSTHIGGWDLDIHHRYNPKDGIVYRGDGTTIDLKQKEKIVTVLTGNFTETVIGPVAIVTNSEGNMFVGDSGFIRKIGEFGRVTNLLKLNSSTTSHKYYITLDPMEEYVYVSDPVNIRILKIPLLLPPNKSLQDNFEVAVGNGEVCSPNHIDCGDGKMAVNAQLVYPKGMAFTKDSEMVFVDGSSIRMVNRDGIISTLAGERKLLGDWKPSSCGSNIIAAEANFNWPTDIAISPLDETITLIDHGTILQVTPDRRVVELFCGVHALNNPPKNLAYTNDGFLIIVDEANLIHKLEKNDSVTEIAGSLSFCKRSENGCLISDFDNVVTTASKAKFSHISDVTVGPDGSVLIADQQKHHIRSIFNFLPLLNLEEKYQVMSPDTGEMYIFDINGMHQRTNGIYASASSSNLVFIYNSNKEVVEVQDANMNKIELIRSKDKFVNGPVSSIILSSGLEYFLKINKKDNLDQVRSPSGFVRQFHYKESSGLIAKKYLDGKMQYLYQYDISGRLKEIISPMGRTKIKSMSRKKKSNQLMSEEKLRSENALLRELYMSENVLLRELYKINPVTSGYRLGINSTLVHQYDWEYFVHTFRTRSSYGSNVNGVGKKFLVNKTPAFTSELHPRSKTQSLYNPANQQLLKVEHIYIPKRTLLIPLMPFNFVEQTYDNKRRPEKWSWGNMKEVLRYDKKGRIKTVQNCHSSKIEYIYPYEDAIYPDKYKTENGEEYEIRTDNSGGIQQILTPLKHNHVFNVQARVGNYLLSYQPPWSLIPFHFIFGENGIVTRVRSPGSEQYLIYEKHDDRYRSARTQNMEVSEHLDKHSVEQRLFDDLSKTSVNTSYTIQANKIEMVQYTKRDLILLSNVSFSCSKLQDQHEVNCSIMIDGKNIAYRMTYDLASHQVTHINKFSFTRDQTSVTITNQKKKFELRQSLDQHGQINLEQIWLKNKLVFTKAYTYDCSGKITEVQEKLLSTTEITKFKYTNNGQLDTAFTPRVNWIYSYDPNSNIENVNFGLGNSTFENEFGERVSMVSGFNKVTYEFNGNMLSRSGYMFHYNDLNQLTKIIYKNHPPKEIIYDSQGRPIIIIEGDAKLYLVYTIVDKPWLLTHVYDSRNDAIKTFTYDTNDKLIAVEEKNKFYVVLTSPNGSPKKLLSENRGIFKEIFRSPFGTEIDDTNEDFNMVVSFNGGVDVKYAGVVIIQGRPYDSILGQWMVPDVKSMLSFPEDPRNVHLYRFNSNDPINANSPRIGYLDTLTEWLAFFNLDLKKMARPILDPRQIRGLNVPFIKLPSTFGPREDDNDDKLLDPRIQKHLTIHKDVRRPRIGRFFHIKTPLLGPNIVISNDRGRISTLPLDGAGSIEKTIAEIINNCLLLENHGNYHETIYFLKNSHINEDKITDLKRHVAVSEQDLVPHGKEVCVKTFDTNLCVISGKEVWELSEWLSSNQNLSSSMGDVSSLVSL